MCHQHTSLGKEKKTLNECILCLQQNLMCCCRWGLSVLPSTSTKWIRCLCCGLSPLRRCRPTNREGTNGKIWLVKGATLRKQNALLILFFLSFGLLKSCTKLSVVHSLVQSLQKPAEKKINKVPFQAREKSSDSHIRPISESAASKFRWRRPAAGMHCLSKLPTSRGEGNLLTLLFQWMAAASLAVGEKNVNWEGTAWTAVDGFSRASLQSHNVLCPRPSQRWRTPPLTYCLVCLQYLHFVDVHSCFTSRLRRASFRV